MLVVFPEQKVARGGAPGRDVAGEIHVDDEVVVRDMDLIMVEVAPEGVLPDAHVAVVRAGIELHWRAVVLEGHGLGAGSVEVHGHERLEWTVRRQWVFGVEDDHQCRSVVEAGVEVPPLIRSGRGIGAQPVLPGCDEAGIDSEALVLLGGSGHVTQRSASVVWLCHLAAPSVVRIDVMDTSVPPSWGDRE